LNGKRLRKKNKKIATARKNSIANAQNTLSFFLPLTKPTRKKNERVFSPTLCKQHSTYTIEILLTHKHPTHV